MSAPVTPDGLAVRAASLYRREARAWAASTEAAAVLELPLHPPTERAVLADLDGARRWVRWWRTVEESWPVDVTWEARDWARVGRQDLPVRVRVAGADAVVAVAAQSRPGVEAEWATMRARCRELREALLPLDGEPAPVVAALTRHAATIAALPAADFAVLDGVVAWLAANPVSGRRVRSLPIRGIDTKWLERHRGLVTSLVSAVTGREGLGLHEPEPRVRLRVLDLSFAIGGLRDVVAPVGELEALPLAPRTVLISENLETLLALPDLDGVVALHGAGYAVDAIATLPWVRAARVLYWGDLDSHGFGILNRARAAGLDAESVLMDVGTLHAHRDLWVPEPTPYTGEPGLLSEAERAALAALRAHGDVRLEQERIPWDTAVAAVMAVLDPVP